MALHEHDCKCGCIWEERKATPKEMRDAEDRGCSCHINPPCSYCVDEYKRKETQMTNEQKRKVVESVGLEWHSRVDVGECSCGWVSGGKLASVEDHIAYMNLDPTDPTDMYGKIIPAFIKDVDMFWGFVVYLMTNTPGGLKASFILHTSTPDLADALLEYFEGKEKQFLEGELKLRNIYDKALSKEEIKEGYKKFLEEAK